MIKIEKKIDPFSYVLTIIAIAVLIAGTLTPTRAYAASFAVEPSDIGEGALNALSDDTDGAGFLLGTGQTLGIVLDPSQVIGRNNTVSIFTVPPSSGFAINLVRFGQYNAGAPVFAANAFFVAGSSFSASQGVRNRCELLGGCDYIEIFNWFNVGGAPGVEVDYIAVDGQTVQVTSPTPEPATWAMMIIGFIAVAWRLKATRRKSLSASW